METVSAVPETSEFCIEVMRLGKAFEGGGFLFFVNF